MGAIDRKSTGDALFGNFKKIDREVEKQVITIEKSIPKSEPPLDWQDALEKITLPITANQREGLTRLAHMITRRRIGTSVGKEARERITSNTIIRALIDCLLEKEHNHLELPVIDTEDDARSWIRTILKH